MKLSSRKKQRNIRWLIFIILSFFLYALSLHLFLTVFIWLILMILCLEAFDSKRIPVLKLHSVTDHPEWVDNPSLCLKVKSFELMIKSLNILGYKTIFLDELNSLRVNGKSSKNTIALTFDDGYLDNWLYVYPILKKYNHKATIYVSTQWIDPVKEPRTLSDDSRGYININEMKSMQESQFIDIQSHAVTHDRVFIDDQIKTFVSPSSPYKKPYKDLFLKLNPEKKVSWYKEKMNLVHGYPVFSIAESLASKEFIPDSALIDQLTQKAGEDDFFQRDDWNNELNLIVSKYRKEKGHVGCFETDDEHKKRFVKELKESKNQLEQLLNKQVNHLAWPRTKWCELSKKTAIECGYLTTTSFTGDHNSSHHLNDLERVAVPPCGHHILDVLSFILEIQVFQGHYFFWPLLWILHRLAKFQQKRAL